MKCPLLRITWKAEPELRKFEILDCLQEECAWWDFERGCCCHKSIYLELDRVVAFIKGIEDKMPHAGQFLR